MTDTSRIVRSTWGITGWTVVSRVAGVFRDATIARFLGASALSDAFYAAFRIPNAIRAVVGEGGLPGAVVPMAKKVARERPGEEGVYAGRVFGLLLSVLVVLVIGGIAAAPFLVELFAAGYRATPGKFELTVTLTRWMFPYILLVSSAALLESFLNSKGVFQLSAATPVAWNLAVVAGAFLLTPFGVSAPMALTVGVLVGGTLQFALQLPRALKLGLRFTARFLGDPEVTETARLVAPRLWGYGVAQLGFLVSSRVLSELGDAFYTYNFCAFRLTDFVLGGFVLSLTRAILPSLSEQALEADRSRYLGTLSLGLRLTGFVTLPAMAGLMLIGAPVIDLIFRRGSFDAHDVAQTQRALLLFALGLFAAAGVKILVQAFYALHETRTPVVVASFDFLAFWAAAVLLARPLQHAGVALATSIGFWINFVLLFVLLRCRLGRIGGRELLVSLLRTSTAVAVMAWTTWHLTRSVLPYQTAWPLLVRGLWIGGVSAGAALLFLGLSRLLGAPELGEIFGALGKRRGAR